MLVMPVISVLERQRQDCRELNAGLGFMVTSSHATILSYRVRSYLLKKKKSPSYPGQKIRIKSYVFLKYYTPAASYVCII